MRTMILLPVLCLPLLAQQVTTYGTDLDGRRIPTSTSSTTTSGNTTTRTESMQSINGRQVPLESVEERVIREDSTGRVVERVIRRFDGNGNPGPAEKQQIEERKNADGSVSSTATVYRGDLNGRFQLAERVITEATRSGITTNETVLVERPNSSGSLDVVEKKVRTATADQTAAKFDETTFRKDQGGRFIEYWRVVKDSADQQGSKVENTAEYEPGDDGRLKLATQTVSRARKNPDGSESREIDIYRNVPGRAEPSATPKLRERQIIEQRKSGDQLIETTLVQRPTINDPNRLGAPSKLSERVCSGANCK